MSDLSNLLGSVYGDNQSEDKAPARPAAARPVEAPEWADESRLDQVFADWLPGPGPGAPAVERRLMADSTPAAPPALDDDLAAALSAALVDASKPPASQPRPAAGRTTPLQPLVSWDPPPSQAAPPAPPAPPSAAPPAPQPPRAAVPPPPPPAPAPAPQTLPAPPPASHTRSHDWAPDQSVIVPASTVAAHRPWSPGDDDITPSGGHGHKRGRRR